VLWVPKDSPVAVDQLGIKSLLSRRSARSLYPTGARSYGPQRSGFETLNIYDQVTSKLVLRENIAQTAQFVQSCRGRCRPSLALFARVAPHVAIRARFWRFPLEALSAMEQGGKSFEIDENLRSPALFGLYILAINGREVSKAICFFFFFRPRANDHGLSRH